MTTISLTILSSLLTGLGILPGKAIIKFFPMDFLDKINLSEKIQKKTNDQKLTFYVIKKIPWRHPAQFNGRIAGRVFSFSLLTFLILFYIKKKKKVRMKFK